MKKMKKVFAALLTLCLILSLSTVAFASSTDSREMPAVNSDFKKVCDQVFQGKGEVYNTSGVDVTNNF